MMLQAPPISTTNTTTSRRTSTSPSPFTSSSSSSSSSVPVSVSVSPSSSMDQPKRNGRKRKAETQENERLSKRLSLLNIEHNGSKLYVPVETPSAPAAAAQPAVMEDDSMHIDNTKHKVYIYNIDDELSSDSEAEDGKLVFLPNIEKHLRASRIPPSILANSDNELAGMQMVLYSDPESLSVPEEQDSVRKAIIESRKRLRQQQKDEREMSTKPKDPVSASDPTLVPDLVPAQDDPDAMDMD